ncbi:hypothetical protein CDO73_09595 [Saccharibacillus sp. O23]|nr:hypothetical protein CDO73_09595 [Saccharibacillus sp. O23]
MQGGQTGRTLSTRCGFVPRDTDKGGFAMNIETGIGSVRVAEKVLYKIVAGAVAATEGIMLAAADSADLPERLRAAGRNGRIVLRMGDDALDIELRVDVRFGERIQQVCRELRDNVRSSVEELAGVPVGIVDVAVVGLSGTRVDRAGEAFSL